MIREHPTPVVGGQEGVERGGRQEQSIRLSQRPRRVEAIPLPRARAEAKQEPPLARSGGIPEVDGKWSRAEAPQRLHIVEALAVETHMRRTVENRAHTLRFAGPGPRLNTE